MLTYKIPFLNTREDLSGFWITDDENISISPERIPKSTLSQLIAMSNTLSDFNRFNGASLEANMVKARNEASTRIDHTALGLAEDIVKANISSFLVSQGLSQSLCLLTGPGFVACSPVAGAVSAAATAMSVMTDVLAANVAAATDAAIFETASALGSSTTGEPWHDLDRLNSIEYKTDSILRKAVDGEVIEYGDFVDTYLEYKSVKQAVATTIKIYEMTGMTDEFRNELVKSNMLDIPTQSAYSYIDLIKNIHESGNTVEKVADLAENIAKYQGGNFGAQALEYNELRATCQGLIPGSCPDSIIGEIASGETTIEQYMRDNIVIKSTDFGEGTSTWVYDGPGTGQEAFIGLNSVSNLTTGSPIDMTMAIHTPDSFFSLLFDYQFLTVSGTLDVLLDDYILASINAPDSPMDYFLTIRIDVTDPTLWGLDSSLLKFHFDGSTGSSVNLDNIFVTTPGFNTGYSDHPSPVPEPSAILLFGTGIAGLATVGRRRKQ